MLHVPYTIRFSSFCRVKPPNREGWAVQLNAGSGVLEGYQSSRTLHHTFLLFCRAETPNLEGWAVQLNAGSGVLESYQCDEYYADAEGSLRKADMLANNEDPLREEANDAI